MHAHYRSRFSIFIQERAICRKVPDGTSDSSLGLLCPLIGLNGGPPNQGGCGEGDRCASGDKGDVATEAWVCVA